MVPLVQFSTETNVFIVWKFKKKALNSKTKNSESDDNE